MEETVMGAYKLGVLDVKLLKVLMEPYRGTDIDSGGSADLKTKEGLEVPDIVIKMMTPAVFKKLEPMRLKILKLKPTAKCTDAQLELIEKYYDDRYKAFSKITDKIFGWQ